MKANRRKLYIAMATACIDSRELAEKAGLPRPTLDGVIKGHSIRPSTIGKVARALGVPVTEILEEDE